MSNDVIREMRQQIQADKKAATEVHNKLSNFNQEQLQLQNVISKTLKDIEGEMRNV